jgi:hypothetical protein
MDPALTPAAITERSLNPSYAQPTELAATPCAAAVLADAAVRLIAEGEKTAPFLSPRDGRVLRLVPPGHRMSQQDMAAALRRVMARRGEVQLEAQLQLLGGEGCGGPRSATPIGTGASTRGHAMPMSRSKSGERRPGE